MNFISFEYQVSPKKDCWEGMLLASLGESQYKYSVVEFPMETKEDVLMQFSRLLKAFSPELEKMAISPREAH